MTRLLIHVSNLLMRAAYYALRVADVLNRASTAVAKYAGRFEGLRT